LRWKKGGIKEDGLWAKHWYGNVHNSEGFAIQKSSSQPLPKHLEPLLKEALPYYETLKNNILKNELLSNLKIDVCSSTVENYKMSNLNKVSTALDRTFNKLLNM